MSYTAEELDQRTNRLNKLAPAIRAKVRDICRGKVRLGIDGQPKRRSPCVNRGLACLECQDEAAAL